VIQGTRLTGPRDAHAEAQLIEARVLMLERRIEPCPIALEPGRVAHVENEPALSDRTKILGPLERGFGNHCL
jgi:hypothetical protein